MAISPVCDAVPPWQVLIGPFAAEHIEAELDHGAPLLLVPNNLEQAEELARQFQGRGGGRLYFSRDLLGAEDREMCWYRYNDPRFDGVSSPEELRPLAPNLRLRDLELRPLVRLDSLIHGWANHDPALAALVAAGGGRIWLQCKQPAPIVAGVSRVVEVISEFCWTPLGSVADPAVGEAALATVSAWLESSSFQPPERRPVNAQSAAVSLIWRQDPLRLANTRLQQLEAELARLRQEEEGRRAAQAAVEAQLRADADAHAQELEAQRQGQEELRLALVAQEEACALERQAFLADRQALAAQQEVSQQALQETFAAERSALAEHHAQERRQLERELEARGQQLEARNLELAAQQQSWDAQQLAWQAEREALAAQQEVSQQALQETFAAERSALAEHHAQERSRLAGEAEALRQELEARRQEQEELRLALVAQEEACAMERQAFLADRQALAAQQEVSQQALQETFAAERSALVEHHAQERRQLERELEARGQQLEARNLELAAQQQSWDAQQLAWQAEREAAAEATAQAMAGAQAQVQALADQQALAERWCAEAERQRQRLQEAVMEIDAILQAMAPSPEITAP